MTSAFLKHPVSGWYQQESQDLAHPTRKRRHNMAPAESRLSKCPYRALWLYCLLQGLRDVALAMDGAKMDQVDRRECLVWIDENEPNRPGSFLWICNELDLDPPRLRRLILSPAHRQWLTSTNLVFRRK